MISHVFTMTFTIHWASPRATKLLCPHHKGTAPHHPRRVEGPDLLCQMALVDTMVEQSLVSSAGGTSGHECVYCVAWLVGQGGAAGWVGGQVVTFFPVDGCDKTLFCDLEWYADA